MRRRPQGITFRHFHAFAFGSDAELMRIFGSLQAAELEWRRLRSDFLARWNMWGMPQAWWRFEPGVPEELRVGPPLILGEADAEEWRRINDARELHLRGIGIDPAPGPG